MDVYLSEDKFILINIFMPVDPVCRLTLSIIIDHIIAGFIVHALNFKSKLLSNISIFGHCQILIRLLIQILLPS